MPINPSERPGKRPTNQVFIRVVRPKAKEPITVVFLGPYRGMYGHFREDKSGSYPCNGEQCVGHERPLVWWGFAPALLELAEHKGWDPVVCELTQHAASQLAGLELRGMMVRLARRRIDNAAIVDPEVLPCHVKPSSLPKPHDVELTLRRMYAPLPVPLDAEPPPFPLATRVKTLEVVDEVGLQPSKPEGIICASLAEYYKLPEAQRTKLREGN